MSYHEQTPRQIKEIVPVQLGAKIGMFYQFLIELRLAEEGLEELHENSDIKPFLRGRKECCDLVLEKFHNLFDEVLYTDLERNG